MAIASATIYRCPGRLESLLANVTAERRVCPMPGPWEKLRRMLGPGSPQIAILTGWHVVTPLFKALILNSQIRYAAEHGKARARRSVPSFPAGEGMEDVAWTLVIACSESFGVRVLYRSSEEALETLFKAAIGHSYVRERVLKAFAGVEADQIHTTELYAGIAKAHGIDPGAISVYVGQLGGEKYGSVLEKTRERYYRFRDRLFKAYAAARPPQLQPGDHEG